MSKQFYSIQYTDTYMTSSPTLWLYGINQRKKNNAMSHTFSQVIVWNQCHIREHARSAWTENLPHQERLLWFLDFTSHDFSHLSLDQYQVYVYVNKSTISPTLTISYHKHLFFFSETSTTPFWNNHQEQLHFSIINMNNTTTATIRIEWWRSEISMQVSVKL